jgi:4-hydroxy-3-methylbut-2-enyl diphosphate reductase
MGMCFGVRDALQIVSHIDDPQQVTAYGELVHNPEVIRSMSEAGFRQLPEDGRDADVVTPQVLITAHGISDVASSRLQAAGKFLIDTTCPLVRRVHEAALELQAEGRHVLLIGKVGHVEVRGVVEDLQSCDVIGNVGDVAGYSSLHLGVVCQTTMPPDTVSQIRAHIEAKNPSADIRFIDTVCQPTKLRQQAMCDLLGRVDAVVVVGGRNSNNTRRLVDLCREQDTPVMHVERADDLRADWFEGFEAVGLTAGTSTLDETIDDVHHALQLIASSYRQTTNCDA